MHFTIDLRDINSYELFEEVIQIRKQTNFFKDLRKLYAEKVENEIIGSGIKVLRKTDQISGRLNSNSVEISPIPSLYKDRTLDIDFCTGYGASYYSLAAISYQHRPYDELPSLDTFFKRENFSIGNFGFIVENGDYTFDIIPSKNIKIVGYGSEISSKKRKSFIALLGVHFDYQSLYPIFETYHNKLDLNDLIDIKINTINYPSIFMCRKTGKLFICNCFKGFIDWKWDFMRFANIYEQDILDRINNVEYLEGICHKCTRKTPSVERFSYEYSDFLRKYTPYYYLENKKRYGSIFHFNKEDNVNLENELRLYFGYSEIGKKWFTETHLFKLIRELYADLEPIFHYRGKEMGGLELDIFISKLKLGIEYQGEQHYQDFDHWGGIEGLEKRKQNDKRKIELCKKNGYNLIEFTYKDDLDKDFVIEIIEKSIKTNNT